MKLIVIDINNIYIFYHHKYVEKTYWLTHEIRRSKIESLGLRYCVNFYDKPTILSCELKLVILCVKIFTAT